MILLAACVMLPTQFRAKCWKTLETDRDALPFVAPCRRLAPGDPLIWLRLGWQDYRASLKLSLKIGVLIVLVSYTISLLAWSMGSLPLLIGMLSAFIFVGPLLAVVMYSISAQLERGDEASLKRALRRAKSAVGTLAVFGIILMIVALIWARAASMVHVFFPTDGEVEWKDLVVFLSVGSVVGSVFCAIIFMACAFSLPMIKDRDADAVTAAVTSVNAVLRNKAPMLIWALIVIASVAIGFATALLGLMVTIPWIGFATWHGYRHTIDASQWPERPL